MKILTKIDWKSLECLEAWPILSDQWEAEEKNKYSTYITYEDCFPLGKNTIYIYQILLKYLGIYLIRTSLKTLPKITSGKNFYTSGERSKQQLN